MLPSVLWHCWLGGRKGIQSVKNKGVWWRWALVGLDGVALSWMVSVSASVNLPLHHKVQKFSSGSGSPGWSRKKGHKTVVVWWCGGAIPQLISLSLAVYYDQFILSFICQKTVHCIVYVVDSERRGDHGRRHLFVWNMCTWGMFNLHWFIFVSCITVCCMHAYCLAL